MTPSMSGTSALFWGREQVRQQLARDVPAVHSVVMAISRAGGAVLAILDIRGAGDG